MFEHPPTIELATFITTAELGHLTSEQLETEKLAILDTIGVTIAAVGADTASRLRMVAQKYGGPPLASVIGTGLRCDSATAALLNGATGHALDYDDISWTMNGHPSVVVLPAVLAIAEEYRLTGRDVLLAYAVGCEVAMKMGKMLNPDHYGHGWHGTGTLGTIGAASAIAKLLELDEVRTRNALAIAASSCGGLRQNFGTDTKPFHAGSAARAGVVAGELAAAGFTGDQNILESRWGFFNVMTPESWSPSIGSFGFGKPWSRAEPGVLLKMYPTCVSTHSGIDAALKLRAEYDFEPEEIERVRVGAVEFTTKILIHDRPQTELEAKFSMQYCVARALVSGSVGLSHFTYDGIQEPVVRSLLERVTMEVDETISNAWVYGTPRPAEVTLTLRDGRELTQRVDVPSGNPEKLDYDSVVRKFHDCLAIGRHGIDGEQVEGAVLNMESVADISGLMKLVRSSDQ